MKTLKTIVTLAGHAQDIQNLKANTVITVFHASDESTAYDFVRNGIDGKDRTHRKYPHYIGDPKGGKPLIVNRGLFVASDLRTAVSFGRAIIRFQATPKTLFPIFPSPEKINEENKHWQQFFPKSDYPALSAYLSGKAWQTEPQALFRGTLSPRAIERVYLAEDNYSKHEEKLKALDIPYKVSSVPRTTGVISVTPEDFKQYFESEKSNKESYNRNKKREYIIEPQVHHSQVTPEYLIQALSKWYESRYKKKPDADIIDSVIHDSLKKNLSKADTYQQQLHQLETLGMGMQYIPNTVAKRLLPKMLKYLNVPKAPDAQSGPERYHGY